MPLFIVERKFPGGIDVVVGDPRIIGIHEDLNVRWFGSFLSADKKKTYCVHEAANAEIIRQAARQAGVPADEIVEVNSPVGPGLGPLFD